MILSRLRAFGAFWYDFIIGDDWRVALGVAAALTATYILSHTSSLVTWWIVPVAVVVLLPLSLRRVIRNHGRSNRPAGGRVGQPPSPSSA